jgi:hypothetical protein
VLYSAARSASRKSCRLDVKVGSAFGGEGARRLPPARKVDGTGYVADLDREGEFVDADAAGAECRAVIDLGKFS